MNLYTSPLMEYSGSNIEVTYSTLDIDLSVILKVTKYTSTNTLIGEVIVPRATVEDTKTTIELGNTVDIGQKVKIELIKA